MRGLAAVLLGGALALAACGGPDDAATQAAAPTTAPGPTAPGAAGVAVAPEGAHALDCPSRLASGLAFSEAPPAAGETREAATVVADALRARGVVPEAADAVESLGGRLERRWAPRPGRPPAEVAGHLGRGGDVDVTASVEPTGPGTPADVAVRRDDRVVAVVTVSEQQPGYWGLDQLWACSEEVAVTEYPE